MPFIIRGRQVIWFHLEYPGNFLTQTIITFGGLGMIADGNIDSLVNT